MENTPGEPKPWPKPENEAKKFLGIIKNLNKKQVVGILTIIIENAKETERHGLRLDDELLGKEENFYISLLDRFGGIEKMTREQTFEGVSKTIGELEDEHFKEESEKFFEHFKNLHGSGSNLRYDIHLEVTRANILNSAYSNKLAP